MFFWHACMHFWKKKRKEKGVPTGFTSEEEVGTERSDHWDLADQ